MVEAPPTPAPLLAEVTSFNKKKLKATRTVVKGLRMPVGPAPDAPLLAPPPPTAAGDVGATVPPEISRAPSVDGVGAGPRVRKVRAPRIPEAPTDAPPLPPNLLVAITSVFENDWR